MFVCVVLCFHVCMHTCVRVHALALRFEYTGGLGEKKPHVSSLGKSACAGDFTPGRAEKEKQLVLKVIVMIINRDYYNAM